MGNRLSRLPSPSMAVAFVALLAALGGTAVALPGKNGVKTDDIAKNAVTSSDVRNNSLTTSDVKTGTLSGSDIGANALTGANIDEGSLGKVPSAGSADTAGAAATAGAAVTANSANSANTANSATTAGTANNVGGVELRKVQFSSSGTVAETTILNFKGLVLKAACDSGSAFFLEAATTGNNAVLASSTVDPTAVNPVNENAVFDGDFDIADGDRSLLPTNEDQEAGSLRYTRADHGGVQLSFLVSDGNATECAVTGTATGF